MNVRWKPLLILSGLFAMTAIAGVSVWIFGFGPGSGDKPDAILAQARIERESGQMDRALIQYRRPCRPRVVRILRFMKKLRRCMQRA